MKDREEQYRVGCLFDSERRLTSNLEWLNRRF